jgi:uncharacterized protein YukE
MRAVLTPGTALAVAWCRIRRIEFLSRSPPPILINRRSVAGPTASETDWRIMSTPNGQISTDIERMQAAEPIFQTALDALNTSFTDMNTQQDTLQANWQGESASSFGRALTAYINDLGLLRNSLISIINIMGQNTHVYANTQENNQQVVQAFQGTISNGAFDGLPGLNLLGG